MSTPLFVGCGVALVTPFGPNGLEEACLNDLVRFHLQERTDALVVNGSTGEAAAMSPDEQRRVAEALELVVERRDLPPEDASRISLRAICVDAADGRVVWNGPDGRQDVGRDGGAPRRPRTP